MVRSQGACARTKAVFFDIGNVLVRFDSGALVGAFSGLLKAHPLKFAQMVVSGDLTDRVERGTLDGPGLFRALKEEMGFQGDYERFRSLWCSHFTLERRSAALLRRAARRGRVYLLSNTNHLHFEFIRSRYAFVQDVDGAILSYRVGMRKPEAGIYRAALKKAGVEAARAFFIDDLQDNVSAASDLGIPSWRFTGPDALEEQLELRGLL